MLVVSFGAMGSTSPQQALELVRETPVTQEFVQQAERQHVQYSIQADLVTDKEDVPESVTPPA